MAEAEDSVHRRADLVAHIGQEHALGPVRHLGFLRSFPQFRVAAQDLGTHGDPFETLHQGMAQPHQDGGLEGNDHDMQPDARHIRPEGKDREGEHEVQQQVMDRDGDRRHHDDTPVAPGDGQRQGGEEIHMHVHLPGVTGQKIDQQGGLPHQRDGGHIARDRRDAVAPPHQAVGAREQGRSQTRQYRRAVHDHRRDCHEGNMQPEQKDKKLSETRSQSIEFGHHTPLGAVAGCGSNPRQPRSRTGSMTSQAPARYNARINPGLVEWAMTTFGKPPTSTMSPPAMPTNPAVWAGPYQGGATTAYWSRSAVGLRAAARTPTALTIRSTMAGA